VAEIACDGVAHESLVSKRVFDACNGGIEGHDNLASAWIEVGPNGIAGREAQRFLESFVVKVETPMGGDLPEPNFWVSL
jgi:hypothetical protein